MNKYLQQILTSCAAEGVVDTDTILPDLVLHISQPVRSLALTRTKHCITVGNPVLVKL